MKTTRLLVCALAAPFLAGAAQAQVIGLITTPAGTFSNSAAGAIAKVVSEKTKMRMTVQAQGSQGFKEVEAGAVEFNLSNSFDATFWATGKGEYEGTGLHKNFRHVAALIPYRVAMHVRADSDIHSIADLKGKRVSSEFNTQKTIGRIIEAYLANGGLSYKDVSSVPAPNVLRGAQDFKAGKTDVMFMALGAAIVKEASAALGGVRVLNVDDTPEAARRIDEVLPGSYILTVNPGPGIDGVSKPTKIIAFDMNLNTSASVSDDVVYRVTKALYENKKDLIGTFKPFALFNPQKMPKTIRDVPTHPGAIKFYKEIGLWPPK